MQEEFHQLIADAMFLHLLFILIYNRKTKNKIALISSISQYDLSWENFEIEKSNIW